VKPVGKLDAGNRHVQFDERGGETRSHATLAPFLGSTEPARWTAAIRNELNRLNRHQLLRLLNYAVQLEKGESQAEKSVSGWFFDAFAWEFLFTLSVLGAHCPAW